MALKSSGEAIANHLVEGVLSWGLFERHHSPAPPALLLGVGPQGILCLGSKVVARLLLSFILTYFSITPLPTTIIDSLLLVIFP